MIGTFQTCENARQDLANISSEYFRALLEFANTRSENTTKNIDIDIFVCLKCHVGIYFLLFSSG